MEELYILPDSIISDDWILKYKLSPITICKCTIYTNRVLFVVIMKSLDLDPLNYFMKYCCPRAKLFLVRPSCAPRFCETDELFTAIKQQIAGHEIIELSPALSPSTNLKEYYSLE